MGEAKRRGVQPGEAAAKQPTRVLVRLRSKIGTGTFGAEIAAADVRETLRSAREMARDSGLDRAMAKDWIVTCIETDRHLLDPAASALALMLLWVAHSGDGREPVRAMLDEGGCTIAYDIREVEPHPTTGQRGFNFRLIGGRSDVHPLAWIMPPADVPTAGNA